MRRDTLHGYERRLAKIGGEIRRVKECAGLPQHVAKEAEALEKRYFEVVTGFPPEVVAVAVLWTAAKAAGAPGPLEDLLKCSKASERRVKKAAWRLKEAVRQSKGRVLRITWGRWRRGRRLLLSRQWSFWRGIGVFRPVRIRGPPRCGWRRLRAEAFKGAG
jgi:hypothetical protein